jgi:hypothetical protein
MGVSQAMASAFVVLGTFLAAAFVRDNAGGAGGWRWAYYFNGIIYGLTAVSIGVTSHHGLYSAVTMFLKTSSLTLTTLGSLQCQVLLHLSLSD